MSADYLWGVYMVCSFLFDYLKRICTRIIVFTINFVSGNKKVIKYEITYNGI